MFRLTLPVGCWLMSAVCLTAASGDLPVDRNNQLRIAPPLPVWPSDHESIVERSPVFRLEGRFAATKYRVEVATEPSFAKPITSTAFKVIDNTGIAPAVSVAMSGQPLSDGQYYWRAFCGDESGYWTPAANYRRFSVSDRDVDAVNLPENRVHPRLLLSAGDVESLKKKVQTAGNLRSGWLYQFNSAYSALDLQPPTEDYARNGVGQHGNYSTAATWYHRHLENVAFVGFITGDERLKRKGVEMLMTACAYNSWVGAQFEDTKSFDPPWHSSLETAMMTEAVAIGYDLLHSVLTDEQRHTVRRALVEKGIRPLVREWADPVGSSQIPRHQLPTGNWVMVCSGSAGLGALALLGEEPEAAQWARLVRNRVRAWFHDRGGDWYVDNPYAQNRPKPIPVIGPSDPNFSVDGGYKESIGYMNYGARYACFFADALRRVTGEDLFPHVPSDLLEHMAWSIMAWPQAGSVESAVVDFGDEGGTTSWSGDLLACLIKNRADRRAAWLYNHVVPAAIWPRSLLWYDPALPSEAPRCDVGMGVFRGIGQAVMRNGWSPQAPMAAIKFHQNRGHTDIGTFFLFGAGGPTVLDSGSANYGGQIYAQHLSQTVAHNVVMVDGQGQTRADGEMLAAVATPMMAAASGELKAAYPKQLASWTRDLIMLPGGLVLIFDQLAGNEPHRFDWVLHPENPFKLTGPAEVSIGTNPARATLRLLSTLPFNAELQDGYHQTLPRKYVRFNGTEPVNAASFLCACQWAPGEQMRDIVKTAEGQWLIQRTEGDATLCVALGGKPLAGAESPIDSDARVAAVWTTANPRMEQQVLMLGGRSLRWKAQEWCSADQPIHMAFTKGSVLSAHVWTSAPTHVRFMMDNAPKAVWLNGHEAPVRYQDGHLEIDLPAGQWQLSTDASGQYPTTRIGTDDLEPVRLEDAPAYWEGVRTQASSTFTDGVDAIDGDVNTCWMSLPGLPMPQWLEIHLPQAQAMSRMEINTRLPCAGRLEAWDSVTNNWRLLGRFETTAEHPVGITTFDSLRVDRLRAFIERIDTANASAAIYSLEWSEAAPKH